MLRCTDHDRVFYQPSSRSKEKNLPKKRAPPKQHFRKENAYSKVSNNNVPKFCSYQVRGSVPSACVPSRVNWSFFLKLWGLIRWAPWSLILFLHQLFFLPQNFRCDPSSHLVFSLSTLLSSTWTASSAARLIQTPTAPPTYPARPGGSSPHASSASKAPKCLF